MKLSQTELTFQQRHYVRVGIGFRVADLIRAGASFNDLYLVVRLSDKDGHWLPGQSYGHFHVPADASPKDGLQSTTHLFVRAGDYKIAVMAYDSVHRRGNLWRGDLHVSTPGSDPLPGIEEDLPAVQFLTSDALTRLPPETTISSVVSLYPRPLGEGELRLTVANAHPVLVDIVVVNPMSYLSELVPISNVLSQMRLKSGCVRASALDLFSRIVLPDRQDARTVDWAMVAKAMPPYPISPYANDAKVLIGESQEPAFFVHSLEQLSDTSKACQIADPAPLHVLIIVSESYHFVQRAERLRVNPSRLPGVLCYNLRHRADAVFGWEELSKVIEPLHPVTLTVSNPLQFRKALANLIAGIERASRELPPAKR
ncbi:MAG: hypothetical protein HY010_14920 [Acidobacteria bacterium]|nr:hypothetical protein [Acidobacteriota bacterium]